MALVRIAHHWPGTDQGCTVFEVEVEATHPDGCDVARHNATRMWREATGDDEPADVDVEEP